MSGYLPNCGSIFIQPVPDLLDVMSMLLPHQQFHYLFREIVLWKILQRLPRPRQELVPKQNSVME
jgi:hypothetical protein